MSPSFVQSISSLLNFNNFWGDRNRSSLTGGFANGIPENLKNDLPSGSFSWQPRTVPWLTLMRTLGSVNVSESEMARLARVAISLNINSLDIFIRNLHEFDPNLSAAKLQLIDVDRKVLLNNTFILNGFLIPLNPGIRRRFKYSKVLLFIRKDVLKHWYWYQFVRKHALIKSKADSI